MRQLQQQQRPRRLRSLTKLRTGNFTHMTRLAVDCSQTHRDLIRPTNEANEGLSVPIPFPLCSCSVGTSTAVLVSSHHRWADVHRVTMTRTHTGCHPASELTVFARHQALATKGPFYRLHSSSFRLAPRVTLRALSPLPTARLLTQPPPLTLLQCLL
jgi:hypothetical protein